ncbi:Splicing factor 3b subunit [Thalictrum thalictroides]|uniref:Splicing factor 3b subunit n=1 Tax=Thalictrum thalictroides TaxID=46969 RepID=A0A7J6XCW6_THATH|nr:Splicing factor 3b subunit [Thalictrum thalictroides]
MVGNRDCTVYVGNLDDKVSERVLYEILVQAGRILDLHIPRDKDTNRPKGFAFVEYETEEIADYAVRLFTGLVTIYNRTLKFGISGQDKSSQKVVSTQIISNTNSFPTRLRSHPPQLNYMETSQRPSRSSIYHPQQEPSPLGMGQPNGYGSNFGANAYDYSRRVLGATWDSNSQTNSSLKLHESRNPITYPSSY